MNEHEEIINFGEREIYGGRQAKQLLNFGNVTPKEQAEEDGGGTGEGEI